MRRFCEGELNSLLEPMWPPGFSWPPCGLTWPLLSFTAGATRTKASLCVFTALRRCPASSYTCSPGPWAHTPGRGRTAETHTGCRAAHSGRRGRVQRSGSAALRSRHSAPTRETRLQHLSWLLVRVKRRLMMRRKSQFRCLDVSWDTEAHLRWRPPRRLLRSDRGGRHTLPRRCSTGTPRRASSSPTPPTPPHRPL